jgi:hypothetical protein
LESDSAIFEGDHKLDNSSGVPSLSSLVGGELKIVDNTDARKINNIRYETEAENVVETLENKSTRNGYDYLYKHG